VKKLETIIKDSIDINRITKAIHAAGYQVPPARRAKSARATLVPADPLSAIMSKIGDVTQFEQLPDGWVRWNLINRDFGKSQEGRMPWAKGKEACATQGGSLGTRFEHLLLVEAMRINPEIKNKFFSDTKESWYWTNDPVAGLSSCAWCVAFNRGTVSYYSKVIDSCVRPVRASR